MSKLTLNKIFSDGLVLQRGKAVKIFGEYEPSHIITVTITDCKGRTISSSRTKSDESGYFICTHEPLRVATGLTIQIVSDEGEKHIIHDVSVGDVYMACGQSNMEFFLKYDKDWEQTKNLPKNNLIHMFNVPQVAYEGQDKKTPGYGYWMVDGDNGYENFSAPGYSFARNIVDKLNIPIAIVGCNWGGSTASAWVNKEVLDTPTLRYYLDEYQAELDKWDSEELKKESLSAWEFEISPKHGQDFEPLLYGRDREWQLQYMKEHAGEPVIPMGPYNLNRPCGLFHHMLEPLIPMSICGVLWYQGESDAGYRASTYDSLLSGLINSWRKLWGIDFPFYIVQLAPFGKWLECGNEEYTIVREKQQLVAATLPDVYMCSIMDLGSYYDIHPKQKMEVGRRLSLLARHYYYGEDSLPCEAPKPTVAIRQDSNIIRIAFDYADELIIDEKIGDLKIYSGDTLLNYDSVTPVKNVLIITLTDNINSDNITVSYGYEDFSEIFIHNEAGLAIRPFRITNI